MLSRTGKRLNVSHLEFMFDKVWAGTSTQKNVTDEAVEPLLNHALSDEGGHSTLLLFGQTGTGKTYTLQAGLECVIKRVSEALSSQSCNKDDSSCDKNSSSNTKSSTDMNMNMNMNNMNIKKIDTSRKTTLLSSPVPLESCKVTFFEIHGRKAYDLLSDRANVRLMSDENDIVHVRGAKDVTIKSNKHTIVSQDLRHVLNQGLALRSIEVTERNPISSRSHAICRISFQPTGGSITLVDLAGSERNYETMKMKDKKLLRESAEINKALSALKNCFRAYHALSRGQTRMYHREPRTMRGGDVEWVPISTNRKKSVVSTKVKAPYRHTMLTRVLKHCFDGHGHRTAIIATCSPTTTDLEHTLNTLKHVSLMAAPTILTQATIRSRTGTAGAAAAASVATGSVAEEKLVTHRHRKKFDRRRRLTSKRPGKNLLCVTENVPLSESEGNETYWGKLVHLWTAREVQTWLSKAEGGRFSSLVLPSHITGEHLMNLGAKKMTSLFGTSIVDDREARADNEGVAWTVGVDTNLTSNANRLEALGRQLWRALRNEQQASIGNKLGLVA